MDAAGTTMMTKLADTIRAGDDGNETLMTDMDNIF